MTAWFKRRAAARDDEGAILIFALIITTTIALVVGVLLTRGDGSLRATLALRQVAGSSYAADAAANIAINDLRTGYGFPGSVPWAESAFNNNDAAGCFGNNVGLGATDTLPLNNFYPASGTQSSPTSALVECTAVSGTGMQGSPVPITNANKPGYAIITLNGPIAAGGSVTIHGGVYSNSTITGALNLDAGDAWAKGACSQTTVTAPGTKHCNSGTTIADPNYTAEITSAPALATLPTGCNANNVAVFSPGLYDDAAALTSAVSQCGASWFQPGNYYFDFHNNSCGAYCPSNLFGTGGDVWTIPGDKPLIAGTPAGKFASNPPNVNTDPSNGNFGTGNCVSPITSTGAVGVQFIFGGDSQIGFNKNAEVEICGTYHADRPPVVLYGLKSGGTPSATPDNGRDISNGGSVVSSGNFTGASVGSLKSGGSGATWTSAANNNAQSTTLTVDGFQPSTTVPAGAILTGATLHVTHKEPDTTTNSKSAVVVTIGNKSTSSMTVATKGSTTSTTTNVPITGTDLNNLQTAVHAGGLTKATVAYTANAKASSAVTTVGPITLDYTYYLPVLRAQSGCVTATSGGCGFFSYPGGNNKDVMYLQGTAYLPNADFNLTFGNFSAEVAKFGIVARQFEYNPVNGGIRWTGPVVEIPDNSPGYGYNNTTVDLKVHVCPAQSSCTTSDPVALTSRVQLWDPSGTPAPPGRQITILSWSQNR